MFCIYQWRISLFKCLRVIIYEKIVSMEIKLKVG